jgi:hypothetical protein
MFQVVWLQTAVNELANAWVGANSAQRQEITAATQVIDQLLQTDPQTKASRAPMVSGSS